MPCANVDEHIILVLDDHDRLKHYMLRKEACGAPVGRESYLLDSLAGASVAELLALDPGEVLSRFTGNDDVQEFLVVKHLAAIQEAIKALIGEKPAGPTDPCAAASIQYTGDETAIQAWIAVDVNTERIQPCGPCQTCTELPGKGVPSLS
jgi:hypothetical protein